MVMRGHHLTSLELADNHEKLKVAPSLEVMKSDDFAKKSIYKDAHVKDAKSGAADYKPKRLNVVRAIKRFAQSANYELDLRMEASFASELKSNTKNDYGLLIPKVFWDLTAQRVLTTEWIDGVPLTKLTRLSLGFLALCVDLCALLN